MTKEAAEARSEFSKRLIQNDHPLSRAKNYWGMVWVEAERPIPEKLRSEFYEELCSPNEAYRKQLEESVRWFGVRYG